MDASSSNGPGVTNGSNSMNRAVKFEDEKRRIIDSCFSKKDADGSLSESYITHIRIIEDGAYQSSPPPPNSNPDQKKPRLIIVGVRKSGRVRMHKARENANGTFSIGKTWPLDDLTAIESFSGSIPSNAEEEMRKQWAGGIGFIVTIGKPYYWQANTQKEKQFFIASLVKIYMKYTGGKSPELIGFDDREREQLLGTASAQPRPQAPNRSVQSTPQLASSHNNTTRNASSRPMPPRQATDPLETLSRPDIGLSQSREPISQPRPPLNQKPHFQAVTPNFATSRLQTPRTPFAREDSGKESVAASSNGRQQAPQTLRKITVDNSGQESFIGRDDTSSLPPRSRGGQNGMPNAPGRFQDRTATPVSQRAITPDSVTGSRRGTPIEVPPIPAPLSFPPERRRPPLQISSERVLSDDQSSENMVPAPLATPSLTREFMRPPARSTERPEAPQPLRVTTPVNPNASSQSDRLGSGTMLAHNQKSLDSTPDDNRTEISQKGSAVPTTSSAELPTIMPTVGIPPEPLDDGRPGLGPMMKKKSKADVANVFRKAASAASVNNAFKPRAGGAAERLREQQARLSEGPDGITGVVPAPSLLRGVGNDSSTPMKTSEQVVQEETNAPVTEESAQEVETTIAPPNQTSAEETSTMAIPEPAVLEMKSRDIKRPKPTSEVTEKQLASLGIESTLLDDRGVNFATLLDDFGWTGEGIHTKSIDQMNDEIDRELNKTQIGGWLSRFEEEDGRIEAIRRGLDISISECEELDGLLTLYGVELGTLNEDIAYIEAESRGLQVQASNQNLLLGELKSLLETKSISPSQLQKTSVPGQRWQTKGNNDR